jgi:hypothetical protein
MMSASDVEPRAVLSVAVPDDGQPIVVAVDAAVPCDLGLVERLLWLRLAIQRSGGTMRATHLDEELSGLLELLGLATSLR